nr:T9SS type A sorting domain-containing protein [Saprospiraceae bacterium]
MLSKDIFIYPNPTHDKLHVYISGKASGFQGFKLTDISGRIVEEGSLSGQTTMLDIQNIEKGVYLLNLTDGRQTVIKKVVKL